MYKRANFFVILTVMLCGSVFPQSERKKEKPQEFGHSLKEFEKKTEQKSSNKTVFDDGEAIRVETNLVISDALVIDRGGKVVTGLQKADFVVTENDVDQKVEMFSFGNDERFPKSVVLIIEAGGTPSIFKQNIKAAKQLVDWLGPTDRMAVVSDNVELLNGFTSDKKLLTATLERLAGRGGPSRREYSTLIAVLKEIFVGDEIKPIVLIQSSGDEALMLKPIWPATLGFCKKGIKDFCERSFGFSDLLDAVEKSRVTIYGVVPQPRVAGLAREEQKRKVAIILDGFSDEIHDRRNESEKAKFRQVWEDLTIRETTAMQQSMIEVTRLSGGFTTFLESADKVDDLYGSLFATIENRYLVGYYSENTFKLKSRTINISIKGHPEYSVVARKSFVPTTTK